MKTTFLFSILHYFNVKRLLLCIIWSLSGFISPRICRHHVPIIDRLLSLATANVHLIFILIKKASTFTWFYKSRIACVFHLISIIFILDKYLFTVLSNRTHEHQLAETFGGCYDNALMLSDSASIVLKFLI